MSSENNDATPFCQGMMMTMNAMRMLSTSNSHSEMHNQGGMIMYMEGFRWTLSGNQPCLNLYFPSWTLDSRGKFIAAMLGVFLLGTLVEGIAKLRQHVVRSAKRAVRQNTETIWSNGTLRVTITLLHGLQAFFGYILMLATMTFSLELLLCTVLGLSTGYFTYFRQEDAFLYEERHVTTNPCCAFMENEAREDQSEHDTIDADALVDPLMTLPPENANESEENESTRV